MSDTKPAAPDRNEGVSGGVTLDQMLEWLYTWVPKGHRIADAIRELVSSYPALREEAEALREENKRLKKANDDWAYQTCYPSSAPKWKARAETAERELAEARPVIEAARKFIAIEGDAPRQVVDRLGLSNKIVELAVEAARAALDKREEPK